MDNEELEALLLYAGEAIFVLFALFSMFSMWANGVFFTWMTLKYLCLMGAAVLTLTLEDTARRRYAIAFAAFLGLLAFGDQLTFSRGQVSTLAEAKVQCAREDIKEASEEIANRDDAEAIAELAMLRKEIEAQPLERYESKTGAETKSKELKEEIDAKRKKLAEKKVDLDDVEDLADAKVDLEKAKEDVDERRSDLIWAKGYDAFMLLGGFLILAGALIGGAAPAGAEGATSYYGTQSYGYGTASDAAPAAAPAAAAEPPAAAPPAAPDAGGSGGGDAAKADGEAAKAGGDTAQADSEAAKAGGDAAQADGEAAKADGDAKPADGASA